MQPLTFSATDSVDMTGKSTVTTTVRLLIIPPNCLLRRDFWQVFYIIIRCSAGQRDHHALMVVTATGVVVVGLVWGVLMGAHRAPPVPASPARGGKSRTLVGSMGNRRRSGHTSPDHPHPYPVGLDEVRARAMTRAAMSWRCRAVTGRWASTPRLHSGTRQGQRSPTMVPDSHRPENSARPSELGCLVSGFAVCTR